MQNENQELPPLGMSVTPMDWPMASDAFLSLVSYLFAEPKALNKFKEETGHDISELASRTGIETLIDQESGRENELIVKWLDFVAIHYYGVKES